MAIKTSEKLIEGLTLLLEGFSALEDSVEGDLGADAEEEEFLAAIVSEVRASLETVIESEDFTPDYIASLISAFTEALEEIDPDVFDDDGSEEDDEDDDEDDDDDDDLEVDEDEEDEDE